MKHPSETRELTDFEKEIHTGKPLEIFINGPDGQSWTKFDLEVLNTMDEDSARMHLKVAASAALENYLRMRYHPVPK